MSNAQQIVEALLNEGDERACAWCQKEYGVRPQAGQSHGYCRRHFMENYATMFSPDEIKAMPPENFCPDLGQQQAVAQ